MAAFISPLRALARFLACLAFFGRLEIDSSPPRLRQANRDRLLRRSRSVLPLANVVHFLAHKFASLRAGRFSLAFILLRPLNRRFFRHGLLLSLFNQQAEPAEAMPKRRPLSLWQRV